MSRLSHPVLRTWPVLTLALLAGLLEWAALSRSRARDAWCAALAGFRHR